jgi:IS1 family transposase
MSDRRFELAILVGPCSEAAAEGLLLVLADHDGVRALDGSASMHPWDEAAELEVAAHAARHADALEQIKRLMDRAEAAERKRDEWRIRAEAAEDRHIAAERETATLREGLDSWRTQAETHFLDVRNAINRADAAERKNVALRSALRRADEWLRLIPEWETDCTDLALETLAALRREIAELGAGAESEKWVE